MHQGGGLCAIALVDVDGRGLAHGAKQRLETEEATVAGTALIGNSKVSSQDCPVRPCRMTAAHPPATA